MVAGSSVNLGITLRLTRFFQEVVLAEVSEPIVIFVDEIDTTLSLEFTDDFYAAIRYLYVARSTDSNLRRLSFVLIGVATPGDLIRDAKRTPFNIGQRVDLTDFTKEEALPLAEGLGLPSDKAQQVLGLGAGLDGGTSLSESAALSGFGRAVIGLLDREGHGEGGD